MRSTPRRCSSVVRRGRQRGRPVSRVLCLTVETARRWPSISGRRLPDGSCGRPEGWAARPSRRTGWSPSYLALLQVELAAFHSGAEAPASSLWRWSSPHGGRALPATLRWGARTFLTPPGCPGDARPSGRLADFPDSTASGREDERIDHALCDGIPGVPIAVVAAAALAIVDLDHERLLAAGHAEEKQPHAGRRGRDRELPM